MRVLVSGASGFVGAPLCTFLRNQGHLVVSLVRSKAFAGDSISWDPENGKALKEDFEGFDAVIHLAGERLDLARWSHAKKQRILFSRTANTWFLSQILTQLVHPPHVFISASAVGYYGDRGEETVTEEAPPGDSFLAKVCAEWENASQAIESRGTRTLRARFGVVLDPRGGALQKMLRLFKLGLGARFGSGNQWISWISLADLIRGLNHLLQSEQIEGAVNFVSPHPIRQKEFVQQLAHFLHRPAFLKLPKWLLHLLLGQAADEMLLASLRAQPTKLQASGFSFRHPLLIDVLKQTIDEF